MTVQGLSTAADAISDARDPLDGPADLDQGVNGPNGSLIVAPGDADAVASSRTPGQVLDVVLLNLGKTNQRGFFPRGVNGDIRSSDAHRRTSPQQPGPLSRRPGPLRRARDGT